MNILAYNGHSTEQSHPSKCDLNMLTELTLKNKH